MKRSIPPRTMRDVSRSLLRPKINRGGIRLFSSLDLRVHSGRDRPVLPKKGKSSTGPAFRTGLLKKPRNWTFQTKPLFKKIKGPLVDVFHEAEEVLIVIDLGGFRRGDVLLKMSPETYSIFAKRGEYEFREEIILPPEVDIENCAEYFRNGVLEIVLPRNKKNGSS